MKAFQGDERLEVVARQYAVRQTAVVHEEVLQTDHPGKCSRLQSKAGVVAQNQAKQPPLPEEGVVPNRQRRHVLLAQIQLQQLLQVSERRAVDLGDSVPLQVEAGNVWRQSGDPSVILPVTSGSEAVNSTSRGTRYNLSKVKQTAPGIRTWNV